MGIGREIDRHTYSQSVTPRVHLLVVGIGREIDRHTYSQSVTPRVHLLVVGMGREMYMKPFRSDEIDRHTYSQSVTPRVHLLVVGMDREINRHTCVHTVCRLPQEYTGWWWVWAERCTRSLFCQTRDQQTPMHTYSQSVSYPKSTSAGSRYRQRDVHEGLEGHGLLATRPAHQRRLELTLAGKKLHQLQLSSSATFPHSIHHSTSHVTTKQRCTHLRGY